MCDVEQSNFDFPEEIVDEIFACVPVAVRFLLRVVSKRYAVKYSAPRKYTEYTVEAICTDWSIDAALDFLRNNHKMQRQIVFARAWKTQNVPALNRMLADKRFPFDDMDDISFIYRQFFENYVINNAHLITRDHVKVLFYYCVGHNMVNVAEFLSANKYRWGPFAVYALLHGMNINMFRATRPVWTRGDIKIIRSELNSYKYLYSTRGTEEVRKYLRREGILN